MILRLAGRGLAARAVGIKAVVLLGGGGTGVLVVATRTLTGPDNTGTTDRFRIERRQYVTLCDDGMWRVDVPAVGG